MPTINNLADITQLSSGDKLPVYSTSNGDSRRISVSSFLNYFQRYFASPNVATNVYRPVTGDNIAYPTPINSQWLALIPAGTLASLTITLPFSSDTPDGTELIVSTTQIVTAFTLALNGASFAFGAPTTLAANAYFKMRFIEDENSWVRIG